MVSQPTITPAERIRELSDINKDVPAMISSAGQAIHALTNRPLDMHAEGEDTRMSEASDNSVEARKEAFSNNTTDFLHGVQGIMARLRRQALALEEAGIITSDSGAFGSSQPTVTTAPPSSTTSAKNTTPAAPMNLDSKRLKNGGLGEFDVGWLNSRGNKVGAEKEAELMKEAKELLEEVLAKEQGAS